MLSDRGTFKVRYLDSTALCRASCFIRVGQPDVRLSELGVQSDGLLEILDGPLERLGASAVESVAALEKSLPPSAKSEYQQPLLFAPD